MNNFEVEQLRKGLKAVAEERDHLRGQCNILEDEIHQMKDLLKGPAGEIILLSCAEALRKMEDALQSVYAVEIASEAGSITREALIGAALKIRGSINSVNSALRMVKR